VESIGLFLVPAWLASIATVAIWWSSRRATTRRQLHVVFVLCAVFFIVAVSASMGMWEFFFRYDIFNLDYFESAGVPIVVSAWALAAIARKSLRADAVAGNEP